MAFRSKFEKTIADHLRSKGIKYKYEAHFFSLWIPPPGEFHCVSCGEVTEVLKHTWYLPDFELSPTLYLETKGRWTPRDRRLWFAMKEQYPEVKLHLIFMRDNYITKAKGHTYSSFCDKHDIPYSIGEYSE